MKKHLSLILFALLPAWAVAGSQSGKIIGYMPYSDGSTGSAEILLIKLDSSVISGCNTTGRLVLSSTSVSFKSSQAAIMAAYHSQSVVKVNYNETCTRWPNSWDANYVCVGNVNC